MTYYQGAIDDLEASEVGGHDDPDGKMNPKVKAEWLKRLRDPNARQAKGVLRKEDGSACCLGVLCEIAVDEGIATKKLIPDTAEDGTENIWEYKTGDEDVITVLSIGMMEWAGLKSFNPNVKVNHHGRIRNFPLSQLNDDLDYTFQQIADLIEEQL